MAGLNSHISQFWDRMILFLAYYRKAGTIYDLHSPYLYRFIDFVMDPGRLYYDMARLRPLRDLTMRNGMNKSSQATGRGHGNNLSCCRRWTAQCLYRIVLFQKARRILILGTGNGLDAIFLNRASGTGAQIHAIEPDPDLRMQSKEILSLYAPGVQLYSGFHEWKESDTDPDASQWDLVFWGRSYDPGTVSPEIVQQIKGRTANSGVWVLAEPHDNSARFHFWRDQVQGQGSQASFLCWSFGVVFFSPLFHEKYHFTFIPWKLKPWGIGLWGKGIPLTNEKSIFNESKGPAN